MATSALRVLELDSPSIPSVSEAVGTLPSIAGSRNRASRPTVSIDCVAIVHDHCAVYTGPEAVEVVLDLVKWTADAIDAGARLLEPACGDGSFLLPAISRLLDWARVNPEVDLDPMIRAYEFEPGTVVELRRSIAAVLRHHGHDEQNAARLANAWIRCEDFLLAAPEFAATHVVGNPPYMRWSLVPHEMRVLYEAALPKAAARGDLCLAFIWKATEFAPNLGARIGFLCADRWLRCAYGREVRARLTVSHTLMAHFEVHGLPVFKGARKVGAYAAVSVLERGTEQIATRFGKATSLAHLRELAVTPPTDPATSATIWPTSSDAGARLAARDVRELLDALDSGTCSLADVGITVRCGTALGLAKAFVVHTSDGLERSRLLPYLRSRDLDDAGGVTSATFVANVWTSDGTLLDLSDAPLLAAHLEGYRDRLEARACVATESDWYRTIDKVHADRVAEPKILVAGMAQRAKISFDRGGHVASNALYCLTSTDWPLEALLVALKAGVVDLFADVVSPRFSGGTKRFDGNVLRQIRLPAWGAVSASVRHRLAARGPSSTHDAGLIADLYKLRLTAHRSTLERTLSTAIETVRPIGARS